MGPAFLFPSDTRASVDLPPVDTGQFLSPSDGPWDATLAVGVG